MVRLVESDGDSWTLFHRHPDTKKAYFADDAAKFYLFYFVRGIQLWTEDGIPSQMPAIDLGYKLDKIEKLCESMTVDADKWAPLVGVEPKNLPGVCSKFLALNKEMADKWQRDREQQIVGATLDPARTSFFQEGFKHARKSAPSLRSLLDTHGLALPTAKLRGVKVLRDDWRNPKEYFTALYHDPTYVEQLGQ